jgi:hypothetical protein
LAVRVGTHVLVSATLTCAAHNVANKTPTDQMTPDARLGHDLGDGFIGLAYQKSS